MTVKNKHTETEDQEFLSTYDPDAFSHPSLAVDAVILSVEHHRLRVVLIQRGEAPQRGSWSLPGGFVGVDEELEDALERALVNKTGLSGVYFEQLGTFGKIGRDPRTRVVSVSYIALVPQERLDELGENVRLGEVDVASCAGESCIVRGDSGAALKLSFDHGAIISAAVARLQGKLDWAPVGYELLGDKFLLRELQEIHEAVLGVALNKDAFRKRELARGLIEPTGEREAGVKWRPGELYRFKSR